MKITKIIILIILVLFMAFLLTFKGNEKPVFAADNGTELKTYLEGHIDGSPIMRSDDVNLELVKAMVEKDGVINYYDNFSEALSNWTDGTTLKLMSDITSQVVTESGTKTLDLNNHVLTYTSGTVIIVSGGTLTICDNSDSKTIHYYTPNKTGVATLSNTPTDYYFEGGYITGGVATQQRGGGLRMYNTGSVILSGGTIFANNGGWGGGIWTAGFGSLRIEGTGAIIGNYSSGAYTSGGGIYCEGSVAVTMTGGSIRHNSAAYDGGGVRYGCQVATGCRFTITGGEITGNYSGNGRGNAFSFDYDAETINIGGTARIIDNQGTNDIYFSTGRYFTLISPLEEGAKIGVYLASGMGTFTNGWSTYMVDDEGNVIDPTDYFVSNVNKYCVGLLNDEAIITHDHSWTYLVNGNQITATCVGVDTCILGEQSLTLEVADKAYDGTPVAATISKSDGWTTANGLLDFTEISYSGNTNVGTYTASIKVGDYQLEKEFTIDKKDVTVVAEAKNLIFNDEEQELIISGNVVGGILYYATRTDLNEPDDNEYDVNIPKAKMAGSYFVWYKVIGDENHNDLEPKCIKVVIAEPEWLTISGTICDKNETPIPGATLQLTKGNQVIDQMLTTEEGRYQFIVSKGVYNIVVEYEDNKETMIVTLYEDMTKDITLLNSKTESILVVNTIDEEEFDVAVGGLDQEAYAIREKEELGEEENVSVTMTVEVKTEETASNASVISDNAKDKDLNFFEIRVEKTINLVTTLLEETATILEIAVPYPVKGRKDIMVYSYHGDNIIEFKEDSTKEHGTFRVDLENEVIYIYSNSFSTYAIGYTPYYQLDGKMTLGSYEGSAKVILKNLDDGEQYVFENVSVGKIKFNDIPKGNYEMIITWTDGAENTLTVPLTLGNVSAKEVKDSETENTSASLNALSDNNDKLGYNAETEVYAIISTNKQTKSKAKRKKDEKEASLRNRTNRLSW